MTQWDMDRVWDAVMAPELRRFGVPEIAIPLAVNPAWGGDDLKSVVNALYAHALHVARSYGVTA
jgi:hypothetical protein